MIGIWRDIGTFEIAEQRLVDQTGVIRTNEWLSEVELEKIRRKILTPRDGEENINAIPVIEESIQNENNPMKKHVSVETGITDEECLIADEQNALMIRNETEEYLLLRK